MTFDGSEKMTFGVSFLRRVSPLLILSAFFVAGVFWVLFAESLSRTRGKLPVSFHIGFGVFCSALALYFLYEFLKIWRPNVPRLELHAEGISIFYSANKFEQYAWKEIEVFSSLKYPYFFRLNNDCVVMKLKDARNGVDCVELPAGLDQSALRLADFLNSQRLKFGSEQNQKNG